MNIMEMMKKAQSLQTEMQNLQQEISQKEFTADSGGGAVTVTMAGDGRVRKVQINPELVESEEIEVLQDLIVAAVNNAQAERRAYRKEKLSDLTGGLPLPPGLMGGMS